MSEHWRLALLHDDIARMAATHAYRQVMTSRRYQSASIAPLEFDDLFQEARYALYRAARNYNPDRGFSFAQFAWQRVKGHLLDVSFPYRRRKGAKIVDKVWSLEDLVFEDGDHIQGPAFADPTDYYAEADGKLDIDKEFPTIWNSLNQREKELIAWRMLHHTSLAEVGRRWGVTESRACQVNAKLKQKLEEIFA